MGTFKAYRFDTIRDIAESVRRDHLKNPNEIPVDIDRIVEQSLKLKIRPVKDLKSHNDMEAMLTNDLKEILIDADSFINPSFDNRTRFSLAHELGHYFLHHEFYKETKFKSPEEWMDCLMKLDPIDLEWYEKHANEFAGRLLVPVPPLSEMVESLSDELMAMEESARKKGIKDVDELIKWKRFAVANKLAPKFKVSSKTIEVRLSREKIEIK